MEWRAFKENGLYALIAKIKEMADANTSAVSGLGEDLVELSQKTTQTLQEMNKELEAVRTAVETLRQDITDGTIALKPVFPVVSADPANPSEGEAWLKT